MNSDLTVLMRVKEKNKPIGIFCYDAWQNVYYITYKDIAKYRYNNAKITSAGQLLTNKKKSGMVGSVSSRILTLIPSFPTTFEVLYNAYKQVDAWSAEFDALHRSWTNNVPEVKLMRLNRKLYSDTINAVKDNTFTGLLRAVNQVQNSKANEIKQVIDAGL